MRKRNTRQSGRRDRRAEEIVEGRLKIIGKKKNMKKKRKDKGGRHERPKKRRWEEVEEKK